MSLLGGSGPATVAGAPIPEVPDLERMRRDRFARLQQSLEAFGLDAMILFGSGAVCYASGASSPALDSAAAYLSRPVVLVVRGDAWPHLWASHPEGAPPELPTDHLHPAAYPGSPEGASELARAVREVTGGSARLACDELTHPLRQALDGLEVTSATAPLGEARICKTSDELACIRAAQRLNELAMLDVAPLLLPGVRQCDLTAAFLERILELGAASSGIDPIWQPMPAKRSEGPWTTHGDVAFPTPSTDRALRAGEVIWVDTGIHYQGYASDFGRTWIVGSGSGLRPSARQQAQFERWRQVVSEVLARCKPGASALDLARAATTANGGVRPWLEHFYLAHGVGTESAEMPLVGTDLGEEFDEGLLLRPGMVLVLEPVIWEDGYCGYRSEDIVAITDSGWEPLSDHPYDPYGETW